MRPVPIPVVPAALVALAVFLSGCGGGDGPRGPRGVTPLPPLPVIVTDGATDPEALGELGRRLFHERRLSLDGRRACATCHVPWRAFAGRSERRLDGTSADAPSLVGSARRARLGRSAQWGTLAEAVAHPFGDPEGFGASLLGLSRAFERVEPLREQYARAFGRPVPEAVDGLVDHTVAALTAFVATLDDGGTAFDAAVADPVGAPLAADAARGWELFRSEGCVRCHPAATFTDDALHRHLPRQDPTDPGDPATGRAGEADQDPLAALEAGVGARDGAELRLRTPSLRDVTRTAPYMHDGRFATLDEVLEAYSQGPPGDTSGAELRALELTPRERADLKAFLASLETPRPSLAVLGGPAVAFDAPAAAPAAGPGAGRPAADGDRRRPGAPREGARREGAEGAGGGATGGGPGGAPGGRGARRARGDGAGGGGGGGGADGGGADGGGGANGGGADGGGVGDTPAADPLPAGGSAPAGVGG